MAKNIVSIFAQMEILQIEKNRPRTAAVHENQNSFIETTNTCINPFSMKRYYSTAFFRVFCCTLGACHTVNNSPIMLKSSLLDSALSRLSREKNELIYLDSTTVQILCSIFWPKNVQKDVCTDKRTKLIFNLFPERKMILTKFKRILITKYRLISCKKWHKLNIIRLCTVKQIKN